MRTTRLVPLAAIALLLGTVGAHAAPPEQRNFGAHATGAEEVPAVDTPAQGQVKLQLSADGSELRYRLNVANIDDVRMAHLHIAPAGQNGPIAVWLYPEGPPPQLIEGRTQGTLATGTITDADFVNTEAHGVDSVADLVEAIRAGDVYANVHTEAFPGGEIRGQL